MLHRYKYGEVPPEIILVISPSHKPLQLISTNGVNVTINSAGSVNIIVLVAIHPLASTIESV